MEKLYRSHIGSYLNIIILSLIVFYFCTGDSEERILSRHKRFLAFPEGSSFSVVICMTIGAIGNPSVEYMSYAINWGLAYDLPNETWVVEHNLAKYKFLNQEKPEQRIAMYPEDKRRHRRDLYHEIGVILKSMGYDGKQCILRALCESRKFFNSRVGTMEEEVVKSIFSYPLSYVLTREHREVHEYDHAYRRAYQVDDCSVAYPQCGFSLLALAFGKHSTPFYQSM